MPRDPEYGAGGPIPRADSRRSQTPVEPADGGDARTVAVEELERCRSQLQRLQADFDNYRKRAVRGQGDQRFKAENDVLLKLLPIVDHFELGLESAREHAADSSLLQGFELVYQQLQKLIEGYGVHAVPAVGSDFDPKWHAGVGTEACGAVPEGKVVREIRRGYERDGTLLRPARVVVSGGPPEEAAEQNGGK